MKQVTNELNDPSQWIAGSDAWQQFCKRYKHLGFVGNEASWRAFARRHTQTMMAKDVMRRSGRNFIADKRRFDSAAFECVTSATIQEHAA